MKLHKNNWPATENASRYRLFSEVMLELVHRSSWDSYRSHTLSTIKKGQELLSALAKVQRKETGKPSLEPQIEELCHAVDNDPVFRKIVQRKRIPFDVFRFSFTQPTERLKTNLQLFLATVSDEYQKCCEDEIVRICAEQGSKIDLILISKLYTSHLINNGFSPEFLFRTIREFFYTEDIKKCTTGLLRRFFKKFAKEERSFDVYVSASSEYLNFLKDQFGFQTFDSVSSLSGALAKKLPPSFGEGAKKGIVLLPDVPEEDAFSAAKSAESIFSLTRSFLYLHPENVKVHRDAHAHVINKKTKEVTHIRLDESFVPRRASRNKSDHAESIRSLTQYVFSSHGSSSQVNDGKHRIFSSLNSASLAAKTNDPESRLLSIWSAFEALLPDPVKDGQGVVRIVHFASLITPCAVFDYLSETYSECFRNCSAEFGQPFVDAVNDLGHGETEPEKFASIFVADEKTKKALCETVSQSPLVLMRFSRLEKLLENPKNACRYLDMHEKRVGWQVNRIYRERNRIVHKAQTSTFLNGLVENAYSYYRSVILRLERVHSSYQVSHPDQGLEMVKALYSEYRSDLKRISESKSIDAAERNSKFVKQVFKSRML